jgi:hypothetical protein
MSEPQAVQPDSSAASTFRQVAPMLFFDVVLPILLYNVLTRCGVSILWSLVLSGISPALNNLRIWIKSRRLEPLGIIVITFLALGAAASLLSGSVFFALIKESFLTGAFGLLCLGSLFTRRPLLFLIIRQFVAGDDAARIAWWNSLYDLPHFRRAIRFVTLVWGIAYIVEAFARVGFALVLTPAQVVAISPIMAFAVLIVLIGWSRRYLTGIRDRAQQQSGQAR